MAGSTGKPSFIFKENMINQVKITTNLDNFRNDIGDEIRAFSFGMKEYKGEGDYYFFDVNVTESDKISVEIKTDIQNKLTENTYFYEIEKCENQIEYKSFLKFCIKNSCYKVLKNIYNKSLPYGSLTGIRPTKLYRKYDNNNLNADKIFSEKYDVSTDKISLIGDIVRLQKAFINTDENAVDLFVNIPFCPSRCVYCSFVSTDISKQRKYIDNYIKCLQNEIKVIKNIVLENNFKVRTMYIGGGTPSSLKVDALESIVSLLDFNVTEFTVEVGRPDTITRPLLEMLQRRNVTRISINPQTFNQKTLDAIGRKHTVEEIYKAYSLAREFDFIINMDLIALLPNESFDDFVFSVKETIKLKPDNITIHTLALKKGSVLTESNYENNQDVLAFNMVNASMELLHEAGYIPYYMYRQKNMAGNLENIGYTIGKDKSCIYNIDIMEENTSIMAAGAGAISKRLYQQADRLERLANMKNAKEYIERFDDNIQKSIKFWEKDNLNN